MTSSPATILVVEDDASLSATLTATLKAAGYRPVQARNAAEGLRWHAHYKPDLILLDLGLPDRDGLAVISEVRAKTTTPIVVLSARGSEAVKVKALDAGADDYVSKPFGVEELLARIRAGLRHAVQVRGSAPVVVTGDLRVDLGRRLVVHRQETVLLSPKEFELLCELALSLGRPVSANALLSAVWGDPAADPQYLRVYVGQLRQKLAPHLIRTVTGVGYMLVADERP